MPILTTLKRKLEPVRGLFTGGVTLICAPSREKLHMTGGTVSGQFEIKSRKDKSIEYVDVELTEHYSTGEGDNKASTTLKMGSQRVSKGFAVKAGETKIVPFALPYAYAQSENDRMKAAGGFQGAMGRVNKFTAGERSRFELTVTAKVRGHWLEASDSTSLKIE